MDVSRRLCCATLMLALFAVSLCHGFKMNGRSKLISDRNNDFNTPLMIRRDRAPARTQRMNRFKHRQNARFESFNRPEGTESFIGTTSGDKDVQKNQDQNGRTFGEYGSYRKHISWQKAVADDRLRQASANQNFKISFPWLRNNLQRPASAGFGVSGFWNSYAFPEGGPNVPGLRPKKLTETDKTSDIQSPVKISP